MLMFKRSLAILAVSIAVLSLSAAHLQADDLSFTLSYTNGFTTCPAGGCASVDVNVSANTATFTVSSLLNGYQFDEFGFNLPSGDSASLVAGSGTGALGSYSLSGAGQLDGFGVFDYIFDTGINGGSTGGNCIVTGGTPGSGCTFSFEVTGTGLTSASVFDVLSTNGNGQGDAYFAGHVAGSACTGFVGGGNTTGLRNGSSSCTPISTPEPSSLSLSIVGLAALGLFALPWLRRRVLIAA
jgi:MYXO-CTERM domain-containing protein